MSQDESTDGVLQDSEVPSERIDAVITSVLVVVAGIFWIQADSLSGPALGSQNDPGPAFWPKAVLTVIIVAGVINLALILRRISRDQDPAVPSRSVISEQISAYIDLSVREQRFFVTIILTIIYLIGLEEIGFLFATPVYLILFTAAIGYHRYVRLIIYSGIVTSVLFIGFRNFMNIALPYGSEMTRSFHIFVENLI